MALDPLPGGSPLSWLASPSPTPVHEPAHPGWAGGGAPRGDRLAPGLWEEASFRPVSDPMVSANLDVRKRHRDPRPLRLRTRLGCAPLRNFGSKSQGAQWGRAGGEDPRGARC